MPKQENSAQWILEGDIKGCFDNINHQWLLTNIPMEKSILTQFLKAGFIYKRHLNPTKAGTPRRDDLPYSGEYDIGRP